MVCKRLQRCSVYDRPRKQSDGAAQALADMTTVSTFFPCPLPVQVHVQIYCIKPSCSAYVLQVDSTRLYTSIGAVHRSILLFLQTLLSAPRHPAALSLSLSVFPARSPPISARYISIAHPRGWLVPGPSIIPATAFSFLSVTANPTRPHSLFHCCTVLTAGRRRHTSKIATLLLACRPAATPVFRSPPPFPHCRY